MTMSWIKKLICRFRIEEQRNYTNNLLDLFETHFFVMFIPVPSLFGCENEYKLKYSYGNIFKNQICYKENYRYVRCDTAYFLSCLKQGKFIMIELKDIGTLVFTNHRVSALFHILQSHYKQCTNYVFCSTDNAGYFKKLQQGKISRKIASHLVAEGIRNYPETRGQPCEFEFETGKTFKIDSSATRMDDMLKDFGKKEILNLFDYYVGFSNIKNENILNIAIYNVDENPNG